MPGRRSLPHSGNWHSFALASDATLRFTLSENRQIGLLGRLTPMYDDGLHGSTYSVQLRSGHQC